MEEVAMSSFWRGRRVLVTGHTGFKGAWLSLWLARLGAIVQGIALPPLTKPNLFDLIDLQMEMGSTIGDIRQAETLQDAITSFRPKAVFHLAAQPIVRQSYRDPLDTIQTNVLGTVHLLEAVRSASTVRAVVNVTTDKCYENRDLARGYTEEDPLGGHDPYSSSKACAEILSAAWRRSFQALQEFVWAEAGLG